MRDNEDAHSAVKKSVKLITGLIVLLIGYRIFMMHGTSTFIVGLGAMLVGTYLIVV